MLKKEIIWREILFQSTERKQFKFTQKEIAEKFGFSLSTVFNALKVPRSSNAVEVRGRFFTITDAGKFLNIWATYRNLGKDIIYQTRVDLPAQKIEAEMPADVIYTAYSAYRLKFNQAPADYDKVYVYIKNSEEIKKRFPPKKGYQNLIALQADNFLANYGSLVPLCQVYVDLWNLKEWQASDFLKALKERLWNTIKI